MILNILRQNEKNVSLIFCQQTFCFEYHDAVKAYFILIHIKTNSPAYDN